MSYNPKYEDEIPQPVKFRKIPGYSRYKASRCGKFIVDIENKKIIAYSLQKSGYVKTSLINDKGVRKTLYVHRVIASAWMRIPKRLKRVPKKNIYVNHINHIKSDNHIDNLEYTSANENAAAKFKHYSKKEKCPNKSILLGFLPKKNE